MYAIGKSSGIRKSGPEPPFKQNPPPPFVLINGQVIEYGTWDNPETLAGDTLKRFVADEAGLLTPLAHSIISTRRSATLGPGRFIGNPGLVAGPFRKLINLAQSGEPGLSFHHWTWRTMLEELRRTDPERAFAYETFIEQERASLPEVEFRRLYEAEWTTSEGAVFSNVDACTTEEPFDLEASEGPLNGERYVIGVDVGQSVDYFVATLLGVESYSVRYLMRFRGVSYPDAAIRLKALQDRTSGIVVVEKNGPGIALIQELDRLGVVYVPFNTTAQSKQEIIMNLAADFQNKRPKLAPLPPLQYELEVFRYIAPKSANQVLFRYAAPPGEHDDTVISLALAAWARRNSVFDVSAYGWLDLDE